MLIGEVPERSKGADCKSVGYAFEGPNPSLSNMPPYTRGLFYFWELTMFYDSGLSFECQRCRYCCSSEPGYVFLSEKDIENASEALSIPKEEFLALYTRDVDYGLYYMVSLKEKDNYDCIFLSDNGCSIYKGRPLQCRTYPFWPSIVENRANWESEKKSCPGIGKGCIVSKEQIDEMLQQGNKNIPFVKMKKKKHI